MRSWRFLKAASIFAVALAAWEVGARYELWDTTLWPAPSAVGKYLLASIADASMLEAIVVTMRRLALGYAIGLFLGLPLGFLTAWSQTASDTLGLVALGLQTLPSVCWVIPAILWFGGTEQTMLFIVVMGTVWSILLATEHGVHSVPPIYVRVARTLGARGLPIVTRVLFPAALPFVVSGMKQGWAFAWRSLMAAEIFVTVLQGHGLGQLLNYGRDLAAMDQVVGVMFVIVFVGLLADRLMFSPFERFMHRRWGTGRA
jgi:NitT/TauT family transport system permease protein